jgi:hypothetical protein
MRAAAEAEALQQCSFVPRTGRGPRHRYAFVCVCVCVCVCVRACVRMFCAGCVCHGLVRVWRASCVCTPPADLRPYLRTHTHTRARAQGRAARCARGRAAVHRSSGAQRAPRAQGGRRSRVGPRGLHVCAAHERGGKRARAAAV